MKPRSEGFTLIEVLVGFTILNLFIATAFQAFSMGAESSGRAEMRTKAYILAQSQLEALAAGERLEPGESERQTVLDGEAQALTWHTQVEPGVLAGSLTASVRVVWDDGEVGMLALLVAPQ